jgi:hypothetical protein
VVSVVLVVVSLMVVLNPHPAPAAAPIPGDSYSQYSTYFPPDVEHLSGQMFLFLERSAISPELPQGQSEDYNIPDIREFTFDIGNYSGSAN